jgi:hypothetical protein
VFVLSSIIAPIVLKSGRQNKADSSNLPMRHQSIINHHKNYLTETLRMQKQDGVAASTYSHLAWGENDVIGIKTSFVRSPSASFVNFSWTASCLFLFRFILAEDIFGLLSEIFLFVLKHVLGDRDD